MDLAFTRIKYLLLKTIVFIILVFNKNNIHAQLLDSLAKASDISVFTINGCSKSKKEFKEIKMNLEKGVDNIVFELTPSEFVFIEDYLYNKHKLSSKYFYLKNQCAKRYIDKSRYKTICKLEKIIHKNKISIHYINRISLNAETELEGVCYYLRSRKQTVNCARPILDSIDDVMYGLTDNDTLYLTQIMTSIEKCDENFYNFFQDNSLKVKKIIDNIKGSLNGDLSPVIIEEFEKIKKANSKFIIIRWGNNKFYQ